MTRAELKKYCKDIGLDYYTTIRYLTSNNYLITIMRGIFYINSIEERKMDKVEINYREAVAEAMKIKNAIWYFGMESALKLHNLTHEFFPVETIINDKIFRPKPFKIIGVKINFVKIKKDLLNFGICNNKYYNYSDIEKTLLDMVYLGRYNSETNEKIKNKILLLLENSNKDTLKKYAKHYPKTVRKFVEEICLTKN